MESGATKLYSLLNTYESLNDLINQGSAEDLYLECKTAQSNTLDKNQRIKLSEAISGFSNTEGGIIIYGMSTTKHSHTGLDVITQIEEIGNCHNFSKHLEAVIPTLTTPSITKCLTRVIKKNKTDSRGIILLYIPKSDSDPVQSNIDNKFYFRNGDNFSDLPYEMLKRLFASTQSPDISIKFDSRLIKKNQDLSWKIPIIISNNSSAVGERIKIIVTFENIQDVISITPIENFRDISEVNPGKKMFCCDYNEVLHRGLDTVAGNFYVSMNKNIRQKRKLTLKISVYANKMRAITQQWTVYLNTNGIGIKKLSQDYIY